MKRRIFRGLVFQREEPEGGLSPGTERTASRQGSGVFRKRPLQEEKLTI